MWDVFCRVVKLGLYKGEYLFFEFVMYWEFIFLFGVFSVEGQRFVLVFISFVKFFDFVYFLGLGFLIEYYDEISEEEEVEEVEEREDFFMEEFEFDFFVNE